MQKLEITINGKSDAVGSLQEIAYYMTRANKDKDMPYVSKLRAETLYYNLTAPTFIGNLTGTATNATKATQDQSGNNIKSTYLNGGSITVTPSTTTVNSITAVGSLPSLSFTPNSTSKTLAIAWSAGTLPTKGSNTTVATGISSATFTGTHPS